MEVISINNYIILYVIMIHEGHIYKQLYAIMIHGGHIYKELYNILCNYDPWRAYL